MGSRVQIHGSVSQTVVVYQTVSADFVIKTPDPVYSDFIKGQAHVGTGKEAADITQILLEFTVQDLLINWSWTWLSN